MNKSEFLKSARNSKRHFIFRVLLNPLSSLIFFIVSRLSKLFSISINKNANTFWGQNIVGVITDPIFSFIYLFGFLDEGLTQMIMKYVRPGMTVVDIGAHIGYETLLSSKIVGNEGRVIAFEPTPSTYNILYKNTRNLKNVTINNMAVWSKNTVLTLFDFGISNSGLNSFFKPRVSQQISSNMKSENLNIPAISLDTYCDLYNIKPDFIKVDAESAEYDIIVGMKKLVLNLKPIIVLEIGDVSEATGKTKKCIRFLKNLGYKVFEYSNSEIQEHVVRNDYIGVYDNLLFLQQ